MFITRSDFYDKLLGKVVKLRWEDEYVYGVVAQSGNCLSSGDFRCRLNILKDEDSPEDIMYDIDSIVEVYNWKKSIIDKDSLSSSQKLFLNNIKMLVNVVNSHFNINIRYNEYSVLIGSFLDLKKYMRRGCDNFNSVISIPIEPFGYLVLCLNCNTGTVCACLIESTECISESYDFYNAKIGSYCSANFILGKKLFLVGDGEELLRVFEDTKTQLQEFVWKGFNFKSALKPLECDIVPYNRISVSDDVINIEYFADTVKDAIGDINSEVNVNKWYKSSKGNYYAYFRNSLHDRMFVYLRIENVYSVSGVVLYKELIACCYTNASRYYYSRYYENVIGRYRSKNKRISLLELATKTNMITSSRYYPEALSCEICPSLGVTRVLDGANQVDVFLTGTKFCLYKRLTYENVITFIKGNECKYRFKGVIDGLDDVAQYLYKTLLNADSSIFEKGDFKFCVYTCNDDFDTVKITSKMYVIDTCYNFLDCLALCKNKKGSRFLIVMFKGDTISGQWKVLLSGNKYCTLSKIA